MTWWNFFSYRFFKLFLFNDGIYNRLLLNIL